MDLFHDKLQKTQNEARKVFNPPDGKKLHEVIEEEKKREYYSQLSQILTAKGIKRIDENINELIENQRLMISNQQMTIEQLQTVNTLQHEKLSQLETILKAVQEGNAIDEEMKKELLKILMSQPEWKSFIADKGSDIVIGSFLGMLPHLLDLLGIKL